MKINRIIASQHCKSRVRAAGTYEAALEIEAGGKTGVAVFYYEYDKRDVMAEQLAVEPALEAAAKAECPEEGPSVLPGIFGDMKSTGDIAALEEARQKATAVVFSEPDGLN